jgi:lysophospholipase L1-like esterase
MPDRQHAQIIDAYAAVGGGERGAFPFDLYQRRCLAQGDSWFSIGALPPTKTSRVLAELALLESTVIVNCAYPGAVLQRMTDTTKAPMFLRLLAGKLAMKWDAILFSGGGNDLIAALEVPTTAPLALRLLRTAAERGPGPLAPADYLSEPGWTTFADHVGLVFNQMIDLRDSGINRSTPLVWHNYARVMPRPAGAGPAFGPWLLPALDAYGVPPAARLAVSDELMSRLRRLIDDLVAARRVVDPACALFVADSMAAGIELAEAGSDGVSGDWVNEIHLTRDGYRKCADAWQQVLDPLLA